MFSFCVFQVVKGLLKFWPKTCSQKEVILLSYYIVSIAKLPYVNMAVIIAFPSDQVCRYACDALVLFCSEMKFIWET